MRINTEYDSRRVQKSISIVLPCHNEEIAVHPVLNRLGSLAEVWRSEGLRLNEVIVVNDASTDGTERQVARWVREHALSTKLKVVILSHDVRRGYGGSLKTGIRASIGDYTAFYDVDGTYDPAQIPEMIRAMESNRASMVCGDRLSKCVHMPFTREVGNRLFVAAINLLFRTRVSDSCTGMRVFSREMREFFGSDALPDGLDYSLAMTLTYLRTGRRLVEVPIPYARRIGRSKLKVLIDGPRFFMRIFAWWVRAPQVVRQLGAEFAS